VARQAYYAESTGESTTTSSTYQDKATLTFTPDANKDYILFWSCDCFEVSTTVSVFTRLYNSTDAVVLSEQNQENRTTTGTPYRTSHGIAKYSAGASPVSTTFKIQYHDSDGIATAKIRNARILAIRVESDDAYTESLADQTFTSNTYVDGNAVLTFTPASTGDYLVFASCDFNHGSTFDEMYIKLLDPSSASIFEMQRINRDAANYNPYTVMVKQNLTNSSKTYKLQIHRTSANTITIKNQRIFAMRLDNGFANTYYSEDRTRATSSSTSYTDDVVLTQTTNAADHLIFGNCGTDGTSNSISNQEQFLEDGSVLSGPFEARVDVSATYSDYYPHFIAYKKTLTAASHTWKHQWATASTGTSGINDDAIAVLEISSGGTTYNDTITESITVTDSEAAAATMAPALSEAITTSDSNAAVATFVTTTSDSITVTDSVTGGLLLSGSVTEIITVTDSLTGAATFNAAVNDTILVADTPDATANFVASNSESIAPSDSYISADTVVADNLNFSGWAHPRKKKKASPDNKPEPEKTVKPKEADDSSKTLQIIESVPEIIDWNKLIISPREVSNDLYHKSLSQMHGLLTEYKDFLQDEDESVEILLLTIY